MVLESIEFDIIQTLKDLTKPFHYSAQKKGISFELISTHLPHKVIGDDGRIGQIVYNLVGNAIKFTKNGGVIVKLEITSDSGDDRNQQQFDEPGSLGIKISVKDTGIGIPAESRSLVFQSFVQAQNSIRRNFGGTGLGLSISKR